MNHKKINLFLMFCSFFMHHFACARYKSKPFKNNIQYNQDRSQIYIHLKYKILTSHECKKYFNTKAIITKGYHPLYISFINNTEHSMNISPNNFSFRCTHYQDMANMLHRNGFTRGLGFGIGALFFIPLIIPAFAQGLGAQNYNQAMDIDFHNKALKDTIIPPYSNYQGFIFVPDIDFSKKFTVTITDTTVNKQYILSSLEPTIIFEQKEPL